MQLEQALLKEHSRAQTMRMVNWIGNVQSRFDELVHLFLHSEYRTVQRAAWPLSYCVERYPVLVKKHLRKIIRHLNKPGVHDAVKRNTLRFLQHINIPVSLEGEVMDNCFRFIASPAEPAAVKAFSITVLENLARKYPDIIPEFKLVLEEQMPHATPAFRVRAKAALKNIE